MFPSFIVLTILPSLPAEVTLCIRLKRHFYNGIESTAIGIVQSGAPSLDGLRALNVLAASPVSDTLSADCGDSQFIK